MNILEYPHIFAAQILIHIQFIEFSLKFCYSNNEQFGVDFRYVSSLNLIIIYEILMIIVVRTPRTCFVHWRIKYNENWI